MRRVAIPCRSAVIHASHIASAARNASVPNLATPCGDGPPGELEFVGGGATREELISCVAADVRAVVVTVTVVPLAEHEPSGIEQLTVSVGVVENPAVLTGIVNALPALAGGGGFGTVTAGAPANVAVALVFALIANVHTGFVLELAHTPDQLVNVSPVEGTAVSVIDVPDANEVPVGDCVIVLGPLTVVASV